MISTELPSASLSLSVSLSLSHTHTQIYSFSVFCFVLFLNLEPTKKKMDPGNHSSVTEFILTGLTEQPRLQLPLFLLFLGIYVVTVVRNQGMITLIGVSSRLHTPMYYFFGTLSFLIFVNPLSLPPKCW